MLIENYNFFLKDFIHFDDSISFANINMKKELQSKQLQKFDRDFKLVRIFSHEQKGKDNN